MSNKLCPYCGEEPEQCGTAWLMCQTIGCPNRASVFTPEQWNRRFVCLDKNGDKVFTGDKVGIHCSGEEKSRATVTFDLRWRYLFEDGCDAWTYDEVGGIELVKEIE